jgi:hypothetical protein
MTLKPVREGIREKVRIVVPFLKWFYVLLLIGGIKGGIVRHIPWKIPCCLAILLIITVFIPRFLRKWVYACLGLIVFSLIVWIFLPESDVGWKPFVFENEFDELNRKYAVPENENAAPLYDLVRKSHNGANPNSDDGLDWLAQSKKALSTDPNDITLNRFWTQSDFPEVASWLEQQKPLVDQLRQAGNKTSCFWPIDSKDNGFVDSSRLSHWKAWITLFIRSGNLATGSQDTAQAIRDYAANFRIGNHCRQQLHMIEWLIGLAAEGYSYTAYRKLTIEADLNPAELDSIEDIVSHVQYDWSSNWLRLATAERISVRSTIAGTIYETDARKRLRHSRSPELFPDAWTNSPSPTNVEKTYFQRRWVKCRAIFAWFILPGSPDGFIKYTDSHFQELFALSNPNYDWEENLVFFQEPLTRSEMRKLKYNLSALALFVHHVTMPAYIKLHDVFCSKAAERQATLIAVELRRYKNRTGQWPDSLDQVMTESNQSLFVDPLNGDSFVYRRTDEGFRFYSTGKDGIDDDGINDKSLEADDVLFWPLKSRKTENKPLQKSLHPDANPS